MLRVRNISNQYQKRTLRPLYAQTQATPWAGTLHTSLRNTDGSFRPPLATDTLPLARSAAAFLHQGGLVPGTVMVKAAGESFVVHNGVGGVKAFGLLANFVGGTIDDLGDENQVGVWRGPDSAWELLKPAFVDTGLAAAYATASDNGTQVPLYAQPNGLLGLTRPTNRTAAPTGSPLGADTADPDVVAVLVEYTPSKIIVDLKV